VAHDEYSEDKPAGDADGAPTVGCSVSALCKSTRAARLSASVQ